MKQSVIELEQELSRLRKCDKVLSILLRHHASQAKPDSVPVSAKWHKTLCEMMWDAKGEKW